MRTNENNFQNNMSGSSSPNMSIGCVVSECRYHAGDQDYCTLQHIQVTKHAPKATTTEITDCGSFQLQ